MELENRESSITTLTHPHKLLTPIKLPVLDALLAKYKSLENSACLQKTAILYVHHPLKTSINLVNALIELGAQPARIFVLGKRYSECEEVVSTLIQKGIYYQPCSMQTGIGQYTPSFIRDINWLWTKLIEKIDAQVEEILIMDHGGHAINYLPLMLLERYKIVGIEKTTAGFINNKQHALPPIPIIDVANSAAKRFLESPLIAEAVVNKIMSYLPEKPQQYIFGVIGLGAIGQAVTKRLQALGCQLMVHDINPDLEQVISPQDKIIFTRDLSALIASSDYIFGCSGRDIVKGRTEQFRLATKNKILVSCSSEDIEFLSLLHLINQQVVHIFDPMDNLEFKSELGATIQLLRGGFPVNFDHSGESVPANDIQLTRALVLAAVLQAMNYFKKPEINNAVYALDAEFQHFIVQEWINLQARSGNLTQKSAYFTDIGWIADHSNGLKLK